MKGSIDSNLSLSLKEKSLNINSLKPMGINNFSIISHEEGGKSKEIEVLRLKPFNGKSFDLTISLHDRSVQLRTIVDFKYGKEIEFDAKLSKKSKEISIKGKEANLEIVEHFFGENLTGIADVNIRYKNNKNGPKIKADIGINEAKFSNLRYRDSNLKAEVNLKKEKASFILKV